MRSYFLLFISICANEGLPSFAFGLPHEAAGLVVADEDVDVVDDDEDDDEVVVLPLLLDTDDEFGLGFLELPLESFCEEALDCFELF